MSAKIKMLKNTSDIRIAVVNNRVVSNIIKLENGNYRVVKLYGGYAKDCESYAEAAQEALNARPVAS